MTDDRPKFTPGPWKVIRVQPEIDTFAIRAINDDTLAAVGVSPVGWRDGKDIANAALMAAAPEMYAMLERVIREGGTRLDIADEILKLLAKARGEAAE